MGATSKKTRMISVCFQGKPFNITLIQVYASITDAEEVKVDRFYKDLQDLLESESETHSVVSYSLPPHGLQVYEILQARILEWVASPFSRESSQPRDQTQVSHIAGEFFTS